MGRIWCKGKLNTLFEHSYNPLSLYNVFARLPIEQPM
jgi:hypothetical protein